MVAPHKAHNITKYYEFHENNYHTIEECRELKKAIHELMDKWQIDRFLKQVPRAFNKGKDKSQEEP